MNQTIKRTWNLLNEFKQRLGNQSNPDIIVFPEFALVGYNFHSREHILPYTSYADEGPSLDLAIKVSKQFGCFTVIGYPEKTKCGRLFNSALVVNSYGERIFNYRKSFLYFTDDNWGCLENPIGFQTFQLPFVKKAIDAKGQRHDISLTTSIGICMDLSPYKFEAPFDNYEFASFNVDRNTELIICPTAWLHQMSITKVTHDQEVQKEKIRVCLESQNVPSNGLTGNFQLALSENSTTPRVPRNDSSIPDNYINMNTPDMACVNYWILRFLPFLAYKQRYKWYTDKTLLPIFMQNNDLKRSYLGSTLNSAWRKENKDTILVISNRCGIEDKTTIYSGSSGIYKFNGKFGKEEFSLDSTNKSVELLGNLGKGFEGLLMRNVDFEIERNV